MADQDGHSCYRITETSIPGYSDTYWIDCKSFLIRRLTKDEAGTVEGRSFHVRDDTHFTINAVNQPIPASTFALPSGQ